MTVLSFEKWYYFFDAYLLFLNCALLSAYTRLPGKNIITDSIFDREKEGQGAGGVVCKISRELGGWSSAGLSIH